jgi:hypothetical protein
VILGIALSILAVSLQGAPPGQEFSVYAENLQSKGVVRVSVSRLVRQTTPAFNWSVPSGALTMRFVPVSGQKASPKLIGIEAPFPAITTIGTNAPDVSSEWTQTEVKVDWTGCEPGYYRLDASLRIKGGGREWTLADNSRTNYWRPMPPEQPLVRVSQQFLPTARRLPRVRSQFGERMFENFGQPLTVVETGPSVVTLSDGRQNFEIELSDTSVPTWLEPVFKDDASKRLGDEFVGKTLYPMYNTLHLIEEGHNNRLRYKQGTLSVVVRSVWRASRRRSSPVQILPYVLGDNQDLIDNWQPLYVVFDVVSGDLQEDPPLTECTRFVTVVADPWEFERVFSTTSMLDDFGGQDVSRISHLSIRPAHGMTAKQVAWIAGWPVVAAPLADTLKMKEWRYEPNGAEPYVYRFENGLFRPN